MLEAKNIFTQPFRRQSSRLREGVCRHFSQRTARHLAKAGIEIDGDNPWDIQIHNKSTFQRVLIEGSLGLGESYMGGITTCCPVPGVFAPEKINSGKLSSHRQALPAATE